MSQVSPCPKPQELQRFLLGQLPPAEIDRLAQHLLQCARCIRAAGTLQAEDPLVEAMHAQAEDEDAETEVVRTLLSRVQKLPFPLPAPPTVPDIRAETVADPDRMAAPEYLSGPPTVEHADRWYVPPTRPEGETGTGETPGEGGGASTGGWPKLAEYEVLGVLGRGGMGIVYKARHKSLKRIVALKMIVSGEEARQEDLARFRSEAEVIARLQHPNIVQIHEIGEHQGRPYFSLEFLDGGSLASKLKGTPQDAGTAAQVVETLARAMHAVHQCGIIHRDLKPGNVLLAGGRDLPLRQCVPKITDFGLAKQLDRDAGHTVSGQIVGTPSYMAPEQAQNGGGQIGSATDVYALGAILYDLLTGRPPFKAATSWDTVLQVLNQEPVPPCRLQGTVPRDLETICLKCLHKEPRQRYASALALAEDLRRFLNREPVLARPTLAWERLAKWARRRPAPAALAGVAGLAPLILLGLFLWHIVVLNAELDQAHAAQALSALRAESRDRLEEARVALARGNLQEAQDRFASVVARAEAAPSLEELTAEAERGLAETQQMLAAQAERQRAFATYQAFLKARDEALIHAAQSTGLDLPGNVKATRTAAQAALDLFGLAPGSRPPPVLPGPSLTDEEKDTIRTGSYELLLILAAAEAQPLPSEDARRQATLALQVLDRAAELRAPTRAYHRQRAACLAALGDTTGAAEQSARAEALQPETAVDHFLLGVEAYQRQDLDQAILSFKQTLGKKSNHFWAEYFLAVCYLHSGMPDQAETCLTVCQGSQPDFVWVYVLRGFAYGELGARALVAHRPRSADTQFKAAEADFRRALACRPLDEQAQYNLLVNRGVARFRQKRWPEAVADFQDAIRLQPNLPHAFMNLAQVYQGQQKWDEATAQLDQAIRLQPNLAALYRSRAGLILKRHDPAAALRDLERAVVLDPAGSRSLAEDQTERGRILCQREQYDEALPAFDSALQVLPGHTPAQRWRGAALLELKRYDEAIAAFDDYLRHGQPVAAIYEARGLARAKRDDLAGALADYGQALALEPGSAPLHTERGWAYLVGGAARLALADFDEAVRLDGSNGDAYAGRGHAHARLGQYRQAVADAEEALRKGPRTSRHLYNVGRIFAQAVAALDSERRPPNPTLAELRWQYLDHAVELLHAALEVLPAGQRLPFWRDYVQTDNALNSIRQTPGYSQLAARYGRPPR